MSGYRMVQYGCGPIGARVVSFALERAGIELVGAVDNAPEKAGRDLGDVAGLGRRLGVEVSGNAAGVLASTRPDVVVHTTGSKLEQVFGQLEEILRAGINVVSTCEELSYPYRRHPELSERLDALAREKGATVVATGINPGFLMDTWPLAMSAVCKEVQAVRVTRVQDASSRRVPFQEKIGAGLSPEEFQQRVDSGSFGHVGLPESIYMIADGLGWRIERIEETIAPVLLERTVRSDHITVPPGRAAGLAQTARGIGAGRDLVSMDFQAYLGAPESYDAVSITGIPDMQVRIEGGTQGDIGTVSIVLNAVPRVVAAPPGLLTMKDLPLVMCAAGRR